MTHAVPNPLITKPVSAPQERITLAGPSWAANHYRNHILQKTHFKKQCLKGEDAKICLEFLSIRGHTTAKFRHTLLVLTAFKRSRVFQNLKNRDS